MRTTIFALSAVVVLSTGCAAESVSSEEEAAATSDDEISAVSQSYVVVRRDYRKCMSPICGGYYVRDANRPYGKEVYVSGLDLSLSGLDEVDGAKVTGAPANELVLRGKLGAVEKKFNTRAFRVTEAYRGLPGVTVQSGDLFYQAHLRDPQITCITAPCNNTIGQKLNFKPEFDFTTLVVDDAAKPFVDKLWLSRRVLSHDAIVAANLRNGAKFAGGYEKVLDASQVFVRIPDLVGPCPMFPLHMCPEGKVNTFSRTADRCVRPTGCATPGICAKYMPVCEPGYTLASWTAQPAGCPAFACEPAFLFNE